MEKLLICFLLLYNGYLVFYLLREKRQENKRPDRNTEPKPKQLENADNIIGKSRFQMRTKMPQATEATSQTATSTESEYVADIEVTFADETNESLPVQLPNDKLDEVFSHHLISEVELEYGENETEDENVETGYAAGISFEEIGEALSVIDHPVVTEKESHQAGQVFTELEGNELFHQLIKSSSQRAQKITELMDYFLSHSISRDGESAGEVVQLQNTSGVPTDSGEFDIRNYV